jgi:ABC-type sugar transport system ATPase subunit
MNDVGITYIDPAGRKTEAVKEITLDIIDKPGVGEIVVFLGPSGCGKSTILKAVAGILPPSRGEILMNGEPVTNVGPFVRPRGVKARASPMWLRLRPRSSIYFPDRLIRKVPRSARNLPEVQLNRWAAPFGIGRGHSEAAHAPDKCPTNHLLGRRALNNVWSCPSRRQVRSSMPRLTSCGG